MRLSYLIIDDFYDDPHAVRNTALHTDYARMELGTDRKSTFHGRGSVTGPSIKTSRDSGSPQPEYE